MGQTGRWECRTIMSQTTLKDGFNMFQTMSKPFKTIQPVSIRFNIGSWKRLNFNYDWASLWKIPAQEKNVSWAWLGVPNSGIHRSNCTETTVKKKMYEENVALYVESTIVFCFQLVSLFCLSSHVFFVFAWWCMFVVVFRVFFDVVFSFFGLACFFSRVMSVRFCFRKFFVAFAPMCVPCLFFRLFSAFC